jgi:outer membrane beta-barrel protein
MLTVRLLSLTFAAIAILSSHRSLATGLDLDPDELRGTTSKKPVAVLQNRFFLKALRPELGILAGAITNEAYNDTKLHGARLGVFVNEWIGAEYQHIITTVRDSEDRKALNKKTYLDPTTKKPIKADAEVNPIHLLQDLVAIAAPLYGKVNILDFGIVYVDLYASVGVSRVKTDQGTMNALAIGGGQRFYFAQRWSTRLDFRNRSFTEKRGGKDSRRNAWTVDFGVSYLFL